MTTPTGRVRERQQELGTPAPMKPAARHALERLHRTIGGSTKYHLATLAVRTRSRALEQDPTCLVCGCHIGEPDQAGLVITPGGDRIACRDECLVSALLTLAGVEEVRHVPPFTTTSPIPAEVSA